MIRTGGQGGVRRRVRLRRRMGKAASMLKRTGSRMRATTLEPYLGIRSSLLRASRVRGMSTDIDQAPHANWSTGTVRGGSLRGTIVMSGWS